MSIRQSDSVSRDREFRALTSFLSSAATTSAGLVVEGEAGIGKTTFALQAREQAIAGGFRVLMTRGSPSEITFSFAGLTDLLVDVGDDVLGLLASVQRDALNRILLRGSEMPAADERAAGAAFQSVVHHLADESPVLIIVDDIQWMDSSSASALRFAVRRTPVRLGVLVTARTGEMEPSEASSWFELSRPDSVRRMRMTPLTLGGVHALISSRLGRVLPRRTMLRIHEISGGNPLYALELAGAVEEGLAIDRQLPDTLASLVRQRVQNITPDATEVLLAAACTPAPTVDVIARATTRSEDEVVELLETGDAARTVVITGGAIRFVHPLLASGVYAGADPALRRDVHRRLAQAVDTPELRARHLASAATSGDAATLAELDTASAIARSRGAPGAAAELLELAIALGGDTPLRRVVAARYHFEAGSLALARDHLSGVVEGLSVGVLRGSARMLQGAIDAYDGSFTAAVEQLTEGLSEVGDVLELRLQGLMTLAPGLGITGRLGEAVEFAREAIRCADELGDSAARGRARAMWVLLSFMYGMGTDTDALEEALRLHGDDFAAHVHTRPDATAAVVAAWTGELPRARSSLAAIRATCIERGSELDAIWADQHATMAGIWSADFVFAAHSAAEMTQRAEQIGGHQAGIFALTCQSFVAAYTGDVDKARASARSAVALAEQTGGTFLAVAPLTSLAFVDVSLGEYESALKTLRPLLETFDAVHGTEIVTGGWIPDAVEALTAAGRIDEAETLVKALEDNGIRFQRQWMMAMGWRGRALVTAARGDVEGAEAAVDSALSHHQHLQMPFEKTRTEYLRGQLQRRRRRRGAAAETLSDVERSFDAMGATLWRQRARAELDRLTDKTPDEALLTPAEMRVARLAAHGQSNKEIAAELYLSVKTVEANLSSVYRKLGIRSRAQLHPQLTAEEARVNPDSQRRRHS